MRLWHARGDSAACTCAVPDDLARTAVPIATPDAYAEMLDRAKEGRFAYPAINVTSSQTLVAALRGFADSDGNEDDARWLSLTCRIAQDLWDDELWHVLATRGVRVARDTVAWSATSSTSSTARSIEARCADCS